MTITAKVVEHLKGTDLRRAHAPIVADALQISETTLRRRLAIEGSSFAALVKAERMRRVQAMPGAGVKRLADVCGYSDHQSFGRAFRVWFGQTYRDYRRGLSC